MNNKPLKIKISRDLGMLLVLGMLMFWSIAHRNEYAAAIAFMYIPVSITIGYYVLFVPYTKKFQMHHLSLVMIFVVSSLTTLYHSKDMGATTSAISASFLWILMTILLTTTDYEQKTIVRIINIYTIIAVALGINTLYNFSTGVINAESNRVVTTLLGTLKDNNFYASFLTPAFAYSLYRFVNIKKSKMYFLAAAVILFLAIIFTGSRAAFIALLVMTGIIILGFIATEKMSWQKVLLLMAVAGVIIGGYIYISTSPVFLRLTDSEDYSTDIRWKLWGAAWEAFEARPIFGGGRSAGNEYALSKWGNYAHNTYLEILCDQGLVGASLFLWLFCSFFKVKKENIVFMLSLFVAFFLPLLFISAYQSCGFWFGISLCMIFAKCFKTNSVKTLFEGKEETV